MPILQISVPEISQSTGIIIAIGLAILIIIVAVALVLRARRRSSPAQETGSSIDGAASEEKSFEEVAVPEAYGRNNRRTLRFQNYLRKLPQ